MKLPAAQQEVYNVLPAADMKYTWSATCNIRKQADKISFWAAKVVYMLIMQPHHSLHRTHVPDLLSLNILKSSKHCRQNENWRTAFKMADFLLGQKKKILKIDSRLYRWDLWVLQISWRSKKVFDHMESPGHTKSWWIINVFTRRDVCAEFLFRLLNVLFLLAMNTLNLQKQW